jgi:glucose/arabinose dehydrogenase/PKD repeat protein
MRVALRSFVSFAAAALLPVLAGAPIATGAAPTLPDGFQESEVFTGLLNPTAVRFAANGQVFVAEKSGMVYVYDGVSDPTPTTVVDLRTQVHNFWDRGLLGLAIDPQFPTRPYAYVFYSHDVKLDGTVPRWGNVNGTSDPCPSPPGPTSDGCVINGKLSRIDINPVTMAGVEVPLLQAHWCQQYPSHSTGDLAFGPDGMLYATSGDGASFNFVDWGQDGSPVNPCGDPGGPLPAPPSAEGGALRSQDILTSGDPLSLDGTLLRIDVSNPAAGAQVPLDNPLVGGPTAEDDLIIAHGLRNPFRLANRPGTDEMWISEVGWETWEEINRVVDPTDATVENFGWPCFEGSYNGTNGVSTRQAGYDAANLAICENLYANNNTPLGGGATSVLTAPFYSYNHSAKVVPGELCGTGSSSATGSAFYQGGDYPATYDDAYFFADSSRQCIWSIPVGPSGVPDPALREPFVSNASGRVVDVQIGPDGDVYYADFDNGKIWRVEYFATNVPPIAVVTADPTNGAAPLEVSFDASESTHPSAVLSFAWDLDGDGAFDDSTAVAPTHVFDTPGAHTVRVRVSEPGGGSDVASIVITADNTPPVVEILSPSPSLLWKVGDPIHFAGQAIDAQDGLLPPENLTWSVLIHHCTTLTECHTHSVQDIPGVASGDFAAPDHDYPSYLEIRLGASDLGGANWWDGAWAKRQRLTFAHSEASEDLDGFPVLVSLDPTKVDYGQIASNGADLRFIDADHETVLPYQVDTWNEAGVSTVWVRVPRIDGGSTVDHIWMYYGNASAPAGQNAAATWEDYAAVWHLGGSLTDSTGNGNNGLNGGTLITAGRFGSSRRFNGAANITGGNGATLRITGELTIEGWVANTDPNLSGPRRIVTKKPSDAAAEGYTLEYHPADNHLTARGSGTSFARADGVDFDTGWHWVGATIDGTVGRVFVDGEDATTDATVSPLAVGNQPLLLGGEIAGSWSGRMDEVRIAPVARSADWMRAQWLSMVDELIEWSPPENGALLFASTFVEVHPATVHLSFSTYPQGFSLGLGPDLLQAPFTRTVIVGSSQSISAPSPQTGLDGISRTFQLWSDGGAASHNVVAPQIPSVLTAYYLMPECRDGIDNDSDGDVDFPEDPGCAGELTVKEGTACDNGLDDDGDGTIDWDGGPASGTPDANCANNPRRNSEKAGCGIGFELAAIVPLLEAIRRRKVARA